MISDWSDFSTFSLGARVSRSFTNTGKIEGKRRRGQQRIRWLDRATNSMDRNLSKLREIVKNRKPVVLQFMGLQRVRYDLAD